MKQIAVGGVELNEVEAGIHGTARGAGERGDRLSDLAGGELAGFGQAGEGDR